MRRRDGSGDQVHRPGQAAWRAGTEGGRQIREQAWAPGPGRVDNQRGADIEATGPKTVLCLHAGDPLTIT